MKTPTRYGAMPIRRSPRPTRRSRPSRNWAVTRQPSSRPPKAEALICRAYAHWYWSTCSACITTPTTGRPRGTYMEHARNRAEPEIQPGNGSRGLKKMIEEYRNRHPAHRRCDLLGSQVPFQLQGRLLLRIARLPVPRGLGQRHQIRKHGARVGSQIAAPRPRLPGRIPRATR